MASRAAVTNAQRQLDWDVFLVSRYVCLRIHPSMYRPQRILPRICERRPLDAHHGIAARPDIEVGGLVGVRRIGGRLSFFKVRRGTRLLHTSRSFAIRMPRECEVIPCEVAWGERWVSRRSRRRDDGDVSRRRGESGNH